MTAEQLSTERLSASRLEELLGNVNTEKWVRGINDYGNPVVRLNYGGVYGTSGDGFKDELDLLMLTPSLARRVLAAEKLVEAASEALANYFEESGEYISGMVELRKALTAYREINP